MHGELLVHFFPTVLRIYRLRDAELDLYVEDEAAGFWEFKRNHPKEGLIE